MKLATVSMFAGAAATHYEKPPCGSDEFEGQIQGTTGVACFPKCTGTSCPTDPPSGVTATPQCAIQDTKGNKYCGLICSQTSQCDTAGGSTCQMVQGTIGLCMYPKQAAAHEAAMFHAAMTPTVHPERQAMIDEVNSDPKSTWKATSHARFAAKPPGASKTLCGVKGDWKAHIQSKVAAGEIEEVLQDSTKAIPDSFDSETNWPKCAKTIGDIRDQSDCGCCWAFGGTEAASDRMCIASQGQLQVPLSAQDVCFNSNFDGCDGGQIDTPWSYISRTGAVSGGQYQGSGTFGKGFCSDFSLPHCHHHGPQGKDPYPAEGSAGCPSQHSPAGPKQCDATAAGEHKDFSSDKYTFSGRMQTASGESAIQQAIMAGGPVETAFTVYSDFENYAGGIYQHKSGSVAGGHAVKFVGWGEEGGVKYWKVANSWNPYWGEKGYFRIVRGGGSSIESQVTFSPPDAKWSKKSSQVVV